MKIRVKSGLLRMHDLLQAAPVTRRAVRFYEEQGLLSPIGRDQHGRRIYGYGDVMRLRLIHELRTAGLSLAAIRCMLELRGGEAADREELPTLEGSPSRV